MSEIALAEVAAQSAGILQEALRPVTDLASDLKSAGMGALVKSINIAAEPALDILEEISDTMAPVFEPLFDVLSQSLMDQLPEIAEIVTNMQPQFEELANQIPSIVELLPDIVQVFIDFTAFKWQTLIDFIDVYGEDLTKALIDISTAMMENIHAVKAFTDLFTWEGLNRYANGGYLPGDEATL